MFLTRTFLFVNRFLKFLLHILRQTSCYIVPRKIFLLHLNSCKISAKNHYHTLQNRLGYNHFSSIFSILKFNVTTNLITCNIKNVSMIMYNESLSLPSTSGNSSSSQSQHLRVIVLTDKQEGMK